MNCFQKVIAKMGLSINSQGDLGWLFSVLIMGSALYVMSETAQELDEALETPTGDHDVVDTFTNAAKESIRRLEAAGIAYNSAEKVKTLLQGVSDKIAQGR